MRTDVRIKKGSERMFKVGDKVRIKPEWCGNENDKKREYTVDNVNDITKRCYISTLLPGFSFRTSSIVAFCMIEKIEQN